MCTMRHCVGGGGGDGCEPCGIAVVAEGEMGVHCVPCGITVMAAVEMGVHHAALQWWGCWWWKFSVAGVAELAAEPTGVVCILKIL